MMVTMERYGRPLLDVDDKLSAVVSIPVTPAQRRELEEQARRAGFRSLAGYVRERILAAATETPTAAGEVN